MEGPPLGPSGKDITWPDQVVPRGGKASSTPNLKPQSSNLKPGHDQPGWVTHPASIMAFFMTDDPEIDHHATVSDRKRPVPLSSEVPRVGSIFDYFWVILLLSTGI